MPVLYIVATHTLPVYKHLSDEMLCEVRAYIPIRKEMYIQTVQMSAGNTHSPTVCEACALLYTTLANFRNQSAGFFSHQPNVDVSYNIRIALP